MIKAFDMELIKRQIDLYIKADRKTKKRIIDEYIKLTGVKRKTAIKRFNRFIKPCKFRYEKSLTKRGRPVKYGSLEKDILRQIWELSGYLCGERLIWFIRQNRKIIEDMFSGYGKACERVININEGSCKYLISKFPKYKKRRYYKGNSDIYKYVAIDAHFSRFSNEGPGYFELDLVEHKDNSSSGLYAVTVNFVDVYSQFVSRYAGLGKDYQTINYITHKAIDKIPFNVLALHPDNEKSLLKMAYERSKTNTISCSRSRAYKKNDNSYVEQKNGDKVRKLVGYYRYDTELEVNLINQIYEIADLIDNYFIPSFKLKKKIIDEKGRVIKRVFSRPMTPYQRIMESKKVSEEVKEKMRKIYEGLNYLELKKKQDELISKLLNLKTGKMKITEIMDQECEVYA